MSEVIEERGNYRLRLERHEYAEPPYDDGGAPIMEIWPPHRAGWDYEVEQNTRVSSYQVPTEIHLALTRWATQTDLFARYLHIFHGTTQVVCFVSPHRGDAEYVSFDTADWREKIGAPENAVDVSEFRAWLEGDVYGYIIEEKVTWQRLGSDGEPVFLVDEPTRETWELVDSCWGFYGYEYAEESAREALDAHIEDD